jgi:hypothetical protein
MGGIAAAMGPTTGVAAAATNGAAFWAVVGPPVGAAVGIATGTGAGGMTVFGKSAAAAGIRFASKERIGFTGGAATCTLTVGAGVALDAKYARN